MNSQPLKSLGKRGGSLTAEPNLPALGAENIGGTPIGVPHFARRRPKRPGLRLGLPWNMTQLETLPFKRGEPTATAGLRASLKAPDLQKRRPDLLHRFAREGYPDIPPHAAFLEYMVHDFDAGLAAAQAAYRGLRQQGRKRRAALAAAAVGRIHFVGLNNQDPAPGS